MARITRRQFAATAAAAAAAGNLDLTRRADLIGRVRPVANWQTFSPSDNGCYRK